MANVEFQDFSFEVKATLDDITIGWLHKWANTIASDAKENCQMEGEVGVQLRKSYRADVDESKGEALIGSDQESAYWEEFGTGSYAVHGDGRKGWWVYVKGQDTGDGGKTYATEEEALQTVAFLRSQGLEAYATNGRKANYTLENAFAKNKPKAIADLKKQMKEGMA